MLSMRNVQILFIVQLCQGSGSIKPFCRPHAAEKRVVAEHCFIIISEENTLDILETNITLIYYKLLS
jgi:hypothetical protein